MDSQYLYITLALLLPLVGGVISFLVGKKSAPFTATAMMLIGCGFAAALLLRSAPITYRWSWMPGLELGWYVDNVASILICLVYLISLLVHLFSIHYLKGDPGLHRYFFKLGFFTSSMLGLLAADHLLLVFCFWELVGFSSFLLIGFWYTDPDKAKSAKEAFMINRVADAGLLIGVILAVVVLDQSFLSEISSVENTLIVHLAGFGLVIGALGKSAQFPFFGWLPKAMAGPTPVSALIHAATMVAAGVYLLVRTVPFLSPLVLNTTAVLGAITAFMAAYAALTQFDIKKVLAFSTISQLGYMIMGIGVGAYQASLFHLWTHAFFKAGLFLAAGSVINYYHMLHHQEHAEGAFDPQDMRNMGGLRNMLPVTFVAFMICAMALSGLPFFSGFLSKEGILAGTLVWASDEPNIFAYIIPLLAFLTALLTPLYIGRQVLIVFFDKPRTTVKKVYGAEPIIARLPLVILALASLWFFSALNPLNSNGWWLNTYLFSVEIIEQSASHALLQKVTLFLSVALSLTGVYISYRIYKPGSPRVTHFKTTQVPSSWYGRLSMDAWYLSHIYRYLTNGYMTIARFADKLDSVVIDRLVNGVGVSTVVISKLLAIVDREVLDGAVNLTAWISRQVGNVLSRVQSSRVQTQITWMIVALIVILLWFQF